MAEIGSPRPPTSTVELSIKCSNLKDCDVLSKSDPVAVIYGKTKGYGSWKELWRSETIHNNLNPEFKTTFVHEYRFEEHQPIKVVIYDWDSPVSSSSSDSDCELKDQKHLGGFRLQTITTCLKLQRRIFLNTRGGRPAAADVISTPARKLS